MRRFTRPAPAVALVLTAAVVALVAVLLTPVTVVSWNKVVDGNAGYLRVNLGDRLTLTAAPEFRRTQYDLDAFSAIAFATLATLALTARLLLPFEPPDGPGSFRRFLAVCAAAGAFASVDELMGIHETMGRTRRG